MNNNYCKETYNREYNTTLHAQDELKIKIASYLSYKNITSEEMDAASSSPSFATGLGLIS